MKKTFLFMLMAIVLSLSGFSQDGELVEIIGSNTSASGTNQSVLPGYYGFHRTVTMYLADELGDMTSGSSITSISYHGGTTASATATTATIKVYVYESSEDVIDGSITWQEIKEGATLVYDGICPVPTSGQWSNIEFETSYAYQGGNLVIYVEGIACGTSGSCSKYVTYSGSNTTRAWGSLQDGSAQAETSAINLSTLASVVHYMPDIRIYYTPGSGDYCAGVSGLTASNITSSSATITWQEREDFPSFYYQIKTSNGEWPEDGYQTTDDYSIDFSDLNAATTYNVRVIADCGSLQSTWRTITFTTACGTVIVDDENAYEDSFSQNPQCWTLTDITYNSGGYIGHTYGTYTGEAISPIFDMSQVTTPYLKFSQRRPDFSSSGVADKVAVSYRLDEESAWVDLITYEDVCSSWRVDSVALPETSETFQIRFAFTGMGSNADGAYIDNVKLYNEENPPTCFPPVGLASNNVTTESVELSWSSDFTTNLYYKPAGADTYVEETDVSLEDGVYLLEDLNPATVYEWYVTSICDDGSEVASPVYTFSTACGTIVVDDEMAYEETFSIEPECWSLTDVTYDEDGYIGHIYGNYTVNAVSPIFDISQVTTPYLKFSQRRPDFSSSGVADKIAVSYRVDAESEWVDLVTYEDVCSDWRYDSIALPSASETYQIRFTFIGMGSEADGAYINNVKVYNEENPPTCFPPVGLASNNVTTESVELSWSSDFTTNLYYKPITADTYTEVSDVSLEDGIYLLEDLNPATTYQWYVTSVCDGDEELESLVRTFVTDCDVISVSEIPYSENFETYTDYAIPNCWTQLASHNWNTGQIFPAVDIANYEPSTKSLLFETDETGIIVLPKFAEDLHTLRITFDVVARGGDAGILDIGILPTTNVDDTNQFETVESLNASSYISDFNSNTTYYPIVIDFNNIELEEGYIAFKQHSTAGSGNDWHVDNIVVKPIPECIEPTNLSADAMTESSANLSWESDYSVNLYYKKSSETEYTSILGVSLEDGIYTLEGLTATTDYQWYVSSICDDGTESGSIVYSFRTACGTVVVDDENAYEDSFSQNPQCWTLTGINYNSNGYIGHTYGTYTGEAISPIFDISQVTTPYLKFSQRRPDFSSSGVADKITVSYRTDEESQWVDLVTYEDVCSTWRNDSIVLPSASETYQIRFTFTGMGSNADGAFIDNVKVYNEENPPACYAPMGITATTIASHSATISWTQPDEIDTWTVYIKKSSETEYSEPIEVSEESTYTFTELDAAMTYNVYIVADCETTPASPVASFTTACEGIAEVPFTWNFDSGNTGGTSSYPLPACWSRPATTYPYVYNNSTYATSGTYVLYFYNSGTSYAVLPIIDRDALELNDLQLSFNCATSATNPNSTVSVGVMTNPNDVSTFTEVSSVQVTNTSSLYEIPLVTYTGEGAYVAIKVVSSDYNGTYFDDVTLEIAPDCLPVMNLQTTNVTENSATISWTSTAEEGFNVRYKIANEDTWEETTVSETSIVLSGLESSSSYTVEVTPECGEGVASPRTISFITLCVAVTSFPYFEDFESDDLGCWANTEGNNSNWGIKDNTSMSYYPTEGNQLYILPQHGNHYLGHSYSNGATSDMIVSPLFNLTSLGTPYIVYNYFVAFDAYNNASDILTVYYRTATDEDWTQLATYTTNTIEWTRDSLALPNPSATYQIAFAYTVGNGYGVAVDSLYISSTGEIIIPDPVEPTVVTNAATSITQTSATLNGAITDLGNQTITSRGFEWKATVGGIYATVSATGTTMTANLTGLTANTSYTYKAFATTANGTQYGEEVTFTTLEAGEEPCTPATATLNETVCYGETFTFNGNTYTTTGTYTTTVAGQGNDCDTLYTVTLVVRPENNNTVNVTINPDELPYQFGTQVLETEGTYTEVFTDINGCDSTVVLTLTVNSSINDVENGINVMLYPNPTTEDAMLRVEGINSDATIYVTDVQGRTIKETKLAQGESIIKIETSTLASGVYYIRIVSDTINRTEKLIKK
ncbi:MAG: fibronectin type III domain-containing protein [Bacteroidales bacterium]|nr:fibronectin type III domain-containing protein [Bacteroidales bacterium]